MVLYPSQETIVQALRAQDFVWEVVLVIAKESAREVAKEIALVLAMFNVQVLADKNAQAVVDKDAAEDVKAFANPIVNLIVKVPAASVVQAAHTHVRGLAKAYVAMPVVAVAMEPPVFSNGRH